MFGNSYHSLFSGVFPEESTSRSTGFSSSCSAPACISSSPGPSTCLIPAGLETDSCCNHNQSSISHHFPGLGHTRSYITPPQTGAAFKDHLPLPNLDGGANMDYDAVHDLYSHLSSFDSSDEAGPSTSRRVTPAVREPISPPPTEHLNPRSLPDIDTSMVTYHQGFIPLSPSMFSSYDHDDESNIDWRSDSTHDDNDWASPTSTLLDHGDLGSNDSSDKVRYFDLHPFEMTPFQDLDSEPPPSYPPNQTNFFRSMSKDTSWRPYEEYCNDTMEIDPLDNAPHSPHPMALSLPPEETSSQQDALSNNARPQTHEEDFVPSSPSGRSIHSLPDFDSLEDGFMTPVPHSPRGAPLSLLDLVPDGDDLATFPARDELPTFPGAENLYQGLPETISPALLGPPPPSDQEGLRLFVRPSGVEPPIVRSPSPDEDAFRFIDVQLDHMATKLDAEEFLNLRALRNRALDAERTTRAREEIISERVEKACHALLPSTLELLDPVDRPLETRARKHELHLALEARAEARKARKKEKQRSKEIGLLLELKMRGQDDDFLMMGYGDGPVNVKQLVASMLMKRRDTSRPLANRGRTMTSRPGSRSSSLSRSVSYEDLSESLENIHISEPFLGSGIDAVPMAIDLAADSPPSPA